MSGGRWIYWVLFESGLGGIMNDADYLEAEERELIGLLEKDGWKSTA